MYVSLPLCETLDAKTLCNLTALRVLREDELNADWTAALESLGTPLNSSKVNVVGQGHMGKTPLSERSPSRFCFFGVSQSLHEVNKVELDARIANGILSPTAALPNLSSRK